MAGRENAQNISNQQLRSARGGVGLHLALMNTACHAAGLGTSAKDNWLPSKTLPKDQLTMEDPKRAQGLLRTHLLTM